MGEAVDRTGTFRAEIISYGMKEYKSGAISVDLYFRLTEWWYVGEEESKWWDWSTYGQEVYGHFFVITKEDKLNQNPVDQLVTHCGWDGSFESITNGTWEPTPCQVVIKEETYNGVTQMKADWIDAFDHEPKAGMQTLSAEKTQQLQSRFGGQIRALVGDKIRKNTRPNTPPPSAPSQPKKAAMPEGPGVPADDIPFSGGQPKEPPAPEATPQPPKEANEEFLSMIETADLKGHVDEVEKLIVADDVLDEGQRNELRAACGARKIEIHESRGERSPK